uniref:DNA binding protein HU beta n=1 Tax=Geladintestivirus 1 TaxID=3233133 RepID=A0AAU8MI32_9CAUD
MARQMYYPHGGYEITVVSKEDILETMEANIKDKEVMFEILKRLEIDATKFLNEGRWTGIPYLGSIKFKEGRLDNYRNHKEILEDAVKTMTRREYYMFRTELAKDTDAKIRANRYINWITSMSVKKNKKLYKKLCVNYSIEIAKVILFSLYKVKEVEHFDIYDN